MGISILNSKKKRKVLNPTTEKIFCSFQYGPLLQFFEKIEVDPDDFLHFPTVRSIT